MQQQFEELLREMIREIVEEEVRKVLNEMLESKAGTEAETKAEPETETLQKEVTDLIRNLGVPANIKGYHYLRDAIIMAVTDEEVMISITKVFYPFIAKKNRTTPTRVERAIRHAIEVSWLRGDTRLQERIFGYSVSSDKGKPTNSEFIAAIVDSLKVK